MNLAICRAIGSKLAVIPAICFSTAMHGAASCSANVAKSAVSFTARATGEVTSTGRTATLDFLHTCRDALYGSVLMD